ncbi:MAG: NUDIX hydrolase [Chlorobiaceae bacterium]|jgi:8-oxo-dGDP phosphatase|nr:NUDIX hydrolase [Chlorobiaceae bacterium]
MTESRIHEEPKPWTTVSSRYLFTEPWLTLRKDKVALSNGRTIDDYYISEFPPWCNTLAFTADRKAVLIRQYRHGIGKVHYEIPAGVHDKKGESVLDAAKRELLEETGFGGGTWKLWMELSANPALQNNITYTFLAEGVELLDNQHLDATEEISVHLVSIEELRTIVLDGGMIQALHAAPILKYFATTGPLNR